MSDLFAILAHGRDRGGENLYVEVLRDCVTGARRCCGTPGSITITPEFAEELADELEMWEAAAHERRHAAGIATFAKIEADLARARFERTEAQCIRWVCWFMVAITFGHSPVAPWLALWRAIQ